MIRNNQQSLNDQINKYSPLLTITHRQKVPKNLVENWNVSRHYINFDTIEVVNQSKNPEHSLIAS